MAIGQKYSYGTDAPLDKNYIGQAMSQVDDIAFRNRQEQLQKAKLKKDEDDVKLKELEEYNAKFGVKISGNQSIDDTTTNYAMQAKQQANELTKQIQQTTDFNKKSELMGRRAKIVQSFDILKQIPDMLIKAGADIADGVEKGKYNTKDVNLIQERFKALEKGKVHYYTDDAGNLRFTTYKLDDAENPTGIIDKDQTVAEMVKSLTPRLAPKYDINGGIAEQFVTTVKQDENKIQSGYTTITKKGDLNGRIKRLADLKAREVAENYDEASDMWEKMGNTPQNKFDEEDKRKIANYVSNDLQSRYGKTYEKDIDQTGLRAERKDKEDEVAQIEVVETPPIYKTNGVKPMSGYKTVSVVGGKPIQQIVGKDHKTRKDVNIDTAFLNSYTVTKNPETKGRAIVAEITYPNYKSANYTAEEISNFKIELANAKSKEEADFILSKATKPISYKTELVYLVEKDAAKYLKTVGAKDVSEMADKARVGANNPKEKQKVDEYGVPIN